MGVVESTILFFAAVAGGIVNALAGGGTLITFPMLTAVGVPAVSANVTNTVALCPGYLGGALAQLKDMKGQGGTLRVLLPVGALGGIAGGVLLLNTGEQLFRAIVPYLIFFAAGLMAVQERLRSLLIRRAVPAGPHRRNRVAAAIGIAAVYGGYFGAGLSVITLAVLGLTIDENLTRLNAVKQMLAFVINVSSAVYFLFSGQVVWTAMLVMAAGSVAGGFIGGRIAGRISPQALRWTVVAVGAAAGIFYLL
ncbi:MAG: sulfite exporter TauE/SafE family protein [Syntrophaceae bacterium]